MKNIVFLLLISFILTDIAAQSATVKLYNPESDAKTDIKKAIEQANTDGKHVLLQIGGNWCKWCIAFDKKVSENDTLKSAVESKYIVYHLNYSNENLNEDVLASLSYPQRFGFPVFVVLDGKGKLLHTQNSAYLEEGKGYETKKVLEFFNQWSVAAIDPKNYPSRERNK